MVTAYQISAIGPCYWNAVLQPGIERNGEVDDLTRPEYCTARRGSTWWRCTAARPCGCGEREPGPSLRIIPRGGTPTLHGDGSLLVRGEGLDRNGWRMLRSKNDDLVTEVVRIHAEASH